MHLVSVDSYRIAEIVNKCRERLYFLRVGLIVRPVYKRKLLPEIVLGDGFVGYQHKVLDYPCRRRALILLDLKRSAVCVKRYFALWKIKINRPAFVPFAPEYRRKLLHQFKHGDKIPVLVGNRAVLIVKDTLHRGIRHTPVHVYYRLAYFVSRYVSLFVYIHNTAERKPVNTLIERAYTVAELVREHGDHPVHKIYACSPVKRFPVKR